MNWQKVTAIVSVMAVLIPAGWVSFGFVSDTMAFNDSVKSRHLNEDVLALQKRIWQLEDRYSSGPVPDNIVDEILRIK